MTQKKNLIIIHFYLYASAVFVLDYILKGKVVEFMSVNMIKDDDQFILKQDGRVGHSLFNGSFSKYYFISQ